MAGAAFLGAAAAAEVPRAEAAPFQPRRNRKKLLAPSVKPMLFFRRLLRSMA